MHPGSQVDPKCCEMCTYFLVMKTFGSFSSSLAFHTQSASTVISGLWLIHISLQVILMNSTLQVILINSTLQVILMNSTLQVILINSTLQVILMNSSLQVVLMKRFCKLFCWSHSD